MTITYNYIYLYLYFVFAMTHLLRNVRIVIIFETANGAVQRKAYFILPLRMCQSFRVVTNGPVPCNFANRVVVGGGQPACSNDVNNTTASVSGSAR